MKKIQNDSTVVVHYTGKLEDGSVFDTSLVEGRQPLTTTLGKGHLIKGFENGLINMLEGEKKTIEIDYNDAYGPVLQEMISEVPKEHVPEGVSVGENLQGTGPMGPVIVKVVEVKDDVVVIDANHPLAGKKLIFDLEVVSIS
jgi:FKBP-type peptidyl-prolyl cis-trans isomerase 2